MEYPYQIVAFIDQEPEIGQFIYGDESGGWLPQVALKRRFELIEIGEEELVDRLEKFCRGVSSFALRTTTVEKPDQMPVEAIPITPPDLANKFHNSLIYYLSDNIKSKFPDREGKNYFPHITVEYWGKRVIDASKYENKKLKINSIWLVKDGEGSQTYALHKFDLSDGAVSN